MKPVYSIVLHNAFVAVCSKYWWLVYLVCASDRNLSWLVLAQSVCELHNGNIFLTDNVNFMIYMRFAILRKHYVICKEFMLCSLMALTNDVAQLCHQMLWPCLCAMYMLLNNMDIYILQSSRYQH